MIASHNFSMRFLSTLSLAIFFGTPTLATTVSLSNALSSAQHTFSSRYVQNELNALLLKRRGEVSLVCLEVKRLGGSDDWSSEYASKLSLQSLFFLVRADSDCGKGRIDDQTYKISTVFSNCSNKSCSVRTYIKRVNEWCGTGWMTTKSAVNVEGFEFTVLDGLMVERLGSDGDVLNGSQ
jgi:hypothetical protein